MKAIHIICRRKDGVNLEGLTAVSVAGHSYRSCCWDISAEEADILPGGWLYLHPTKSQPSEFGGRIVSIEQVHVDDAVHSERVALTFESRLEARDQPWRGANHGRAWTGGLVDLTFAHETG